MRKWRYIVPVVGGCLPLAAAGQGAAEKPASRPNVLLIYADDVGFGDLSCNGYGSVPTPHVERLAREGIRFTNAHCAASTSTPARYSMLTGEFAWRRPGTGVARGDAAAIIPASCYTMADLFRDCGYRTAVVGKWHLGLGSQTGAQNWNEEVRPNPADLGFGYSYIMAATADRTPCIFMENGRGVNLDPADPVEVNYERNFPGEPTGRDNLHAVAQREDHRAVVLHFDLGDHRSALALGLHRIARRVGYPLAEERPVTLIVYADFGRTARNGNFGAVGIEQPRGLAARSDGPIVDFAVGLHADDRLGIGVVHGRDVDRVLHVVGILVAEDIVPVGILRDRGDGTAADDCGQRVELLLHRRDLSLEFVEALVHPVDVLPQGRIVEVVAASVSENGRSGEHQSQDSFHSF